MLRGRVPSLPPELGGVINLLSEFGEVTSIREADGFYGDGVQITSYELNLKLRSPLDLSWITNRISAMGFEVSISSRPRTRVLRLCLWPGGGGE